METQHSCEGYYLMGCAVM